MNLRPGGKCLEGSFTFNLNLKNSKKFVPQPIYFIAKFYQRFSKPFCKPQNKDWNQNNRKDFFVLSAKMFQIFLKDKKKLYLGWYPHFIAYIHIMKGFPIIQDINILYIVFFNYSLRLYKVLFTFHQV